MCRPLFCFPLVTMPYLSPLQVEYELRARLPQPPMPINGDTDIAGGISIPSCPESGIPSMSSTPEVQLDSRAPGFPMPSDLTDSGMDDLSSCDELLTDDAMKHGLPSNLDTLVQFTADLQQTTSVDCDGLMPKSWGQWPLGQTTSGSCLIMARTTILYGRTKLHSKSIMKTLPSSQCSATMCNELLLKRYIEFLGVIHLLLDLHVF